MKLNSSPKKQAQRAKSSHPGSDKNTTNGTWEMSASDALKVNYLTRITKAA